MSSGSCSSLIILFLDQQFLYIHVLISTQLQKQGESSVFSGVPSVWLSLLRFPDSEILALWPPGTPLSVSSNRWVLLGLSSLRYSLETLQTVSWGIWGLTSWFTFSLGSLSCSTSCWVSENYCSIESVHFFFIFLAPWLEYKSTSSAVWTVVPLLTSWVDLRELPNLPIPQFPGLWSGRYSDLNV